MTRRAVISELVAGQKIDPATLLPAYGGNVIQRHAVWTVENVWRALPDTCIVYFSHPKQGTLTAGASDTVEVVS